MKYLFYFMSFSSQRLDEGMSMLLKKTKIVSIYLLIWILKLSYLCLFNGISVTSVLGLLDCVFHFYSTFCTTFCE